MSDERPAGELPPAEPDASAPEPIEGRTSGGYEYTVVDDATGETERRRRGWRPPRGAALAAGGLVAALLLVGAGWLLGDRMNDDGGGEGGGGSSNVGNVLQAFSQATGDTTVRRFNGELPPGFPDDVPVYPDARVVSSLAQISGEDATYLIVWEAADDRDDVAAFYREQLQNDPWQVDAGQDGDVSTLHQFNKIDNADVTGVVLASQADGDDSTTIILSVSVVSGAVEGDRPSFAPGVTKPLPSGFPEDVPAYPEALVIESGFRKQPQGNAYIVSLITRDDVSAVLTYYRDTFGAKGWTVADADSSESELAEAQAITFNNSDQSVSGGVAAGQFARDKNYTQIDLTVGVK